MAADINYGTGTPSDSELRLCGDLTDGKRALELGISEGYNSISFARAGARSIAIDPDAGRIAETRRLAADAEVQVQCLHGDLADLGDVASASVDLALAVHTIERAGDGAEDLGRLLRQVHRVLQPSQPLVIATTHPFADVTHGHVYGSEARSIGSWFTALTRANFRVDQVVELGASDSTPAPTTLILRARKEGS